MTSVRRIVRALGALLFATLGASTAAPQALGPGLGNLTYDSTELFQPVSILRSTNGHGMGAMVNGYFMVVDHGDTATAVGIEFWDLSDPRDVRLAYRHEDAFTRILRDAHSIGLSASYGFDAVALMDNRGVQIWDVTDPSAISIVGRVALPDIPTAEYTGIWWIFWQAPYVYVGGTSAGVYVVRVDDPAAPRYVKTIGTGQLGGVVANQVFALGNLMVVMKSKDFGFATLDISDPENPSFLRTIGGAQGYSHVVAAGRIFTSGGDGGPVQMVVHALGHDGSMSYLGTSNGAFSNGAYGSYQDGYFHTGMSDVYAKFDATDFSVVGTASSGIPNRDEDFCQVLGNLAFVGDDHAVGSGLYVHDTQPDSRGPEVTWVHPADGAQNVALTARVGLSMSDSVAFESASPAHFVVRRLGGATLPGKYSVQMGLVNFAPDAPLLPNAVYEVVVDGIEDYVGNRGGVFRSTFSTGTTGGPPPTTPVTLTNLAAKNGKPYRAANLAPNALRYIDRDYTYAGWPSRFDGHTYVMTANDDKFATGLDWLTFDVATSVEVCVLFDDRATALPAWLDVFSPTGESFSGYDVYALEFAPGTVVLGGNANAPMAGAQSMYGVAVLPSAKPPLAGPPVVAPVPVGALASFDAGSVTGSAPFTYAWDFGDGSPPTSPSSSPSATHAYAAPGRYPVVLTVANAQGSTAIAATQIVHAPLTPLAPTHASTIVPTGSRVVVVNTDADTLAALDATGTTKLWEAPVGAAPRTVAVSPAGELWTVCQDDATVHVVRASDGAWLRSFGLPRASRPYGIAFRPDGGAAYVTLEGGAPLRSTPSPGGHSVRGASALRSGYAGPFPLANLLELDPATGAVRRMLALGGDARGLAIEHDSSRVWVSRFHSRHPATEGLVWEVDGATLSVVSEHALHFDLGPDTQQSGRGVPNYLTSLTISPDGATLLVPSKKDNTARGVFRNGEELTFESRTRTIVSRFDLGASVEDEAARIDLDDTDMAQAVAFSPRGDLFVVAAQGSNVLHVFDAYSGSNVASLPVGAAPQGVAFSPDGTRLFAQNFLSRDVTVYDTTELVAGETYNPPRIADVSTVAVEPLAPTVLAGKRIFYDATDRRMNLDGYISCASCHVDGDSDGQVWDFTQAGEGLRNTIALRGRAGIGHGDVHWTANFDEIQDFENDIRFAFSGAGFLLDPDFAATQDPLGASKAGLSADLDALAAYVATLDAFPPSPHRLPGGELTPSALAGKDLFDARGCATCHAGPTFTDGRRHDVGTVGAGSGQGIGQPLAGVGFDTPTLRGVWATAPYLHDGSAPTLREALLTTEHVGAPSLTAKELAQLVDYLRQIE